MDFKENFRKADIIARSIAIMSFCSRANIGRDLETSIALRLVSRLIDNYTNNTITPIDVEKELEFLLLDMERES